MERNKKKTPQEEQKCLSCFLRRKQETGGGGGRKLSEGGRGAGFSFLNPDFFLRVTLEAKDRKKKKSGSAQKNAAAPV